MVLVLYVAWSKDDLCPIHGNVVTSFTLSKKNNNNKLLICESGIFCSFLFVLSIVKEKTGSVKVSRNLKFLPDLFYDTTVDRCTFPSFFYVWCRKRSQTDCLLVSQFQVVYEIDVVMRVFFIHIISNYVIGFYQSLEAPRIRYRTYYLSYYSTSRTMTEISVYQNMCISCRPMSKNEQNLFLLSLCPFLNVFCDYSVIKNFL